jgi:uncharacterized protein (DUF983 family)
VQDEVRPERVGFSLRALGKGRCPRCKQGQVFRDGVLGLLGAMHDRCPVCGLVFLRESGYFLGAMYVSYGLGVLTILPVSIVLAVVLEWPLSTVLAIMVVQTLVSMPLFLRFSRLLWLHADQVIDPR